MLELLLSVLAALRVFFRSRAEASLELLALRQQVAVLKRQRPRPTLTRLDRVFWTTLRHVWPRWTDVLIIVKPQTVVRWHRAGFRLYWRWRSRRRGGRPRITEELQTLIRRLATENRTWGAPRIHGELLKLGFKVSERSVARYLRRLRRHGDSAGRWAAFLANQRSDRRLRFLHRPHLDFPAPLVLLRDRTPSAHDPAHPRDPRAHGGVGRPATAQRVLGR